MNTRFELYPFGRPVVSRVPGLLQVKGDGASYLQKGYCREQWPQLNLCSITNMCARRVIRAILLLATITLGYHSNVIKRLLVSLLVQLLQLADY